MGTEKGINVLSLFDGMSCGQIALEKAGIKVNKYFASEIDKYGMIVSKANYPDTQQLGSVIDLTNEQLLSLPKIDLLMGGSPCQGFSMAGTRKGSTTKEGVEVTSLKQYLDLKKEGFEFNGQSYLFWEFVRVWKVLKPKYFFLENVRITKKWLPMFNEAMGVDPVLINSKLFSAQSRERFYWTNIPINELPKENNIVLKDIVQSVNDIENLFWYDQTFTYNGKDKNIEATLHINGHDILKRVCNINSKSATLTCCRGGNLQKKVLQDGKCRKLTPLEYERLQTVPDNYTNHVSNSQRYNMLGNGWTVDVIAHIFKGLL